MKILPSEIMDRLRGRFERLYGAPVTPRLMERIGLLAGRYPCRSDRVPSQPRPWDQRDALLIAYGDMVRARHEKPLVTLRRFLDERLRGAIPNVQLH